MAGKKLKVTLSRDAWEYWEKWAHRHQPWEREPDRPQTLKDATLLPVTMPSGRTVNRLWLPSGHIRPIPVRGGARDFDGTNDLLTVNSSPVDGEPFTMGVYGASDDTTNNKFAMSIGLSSGDDRCWALRWAGGFTNDPVNAVSVDNTSASASSTTGYSAGTWTHCLGTFISSSSRKVWRDGGSEGTSVVTQSVPITPNQLKIGGQVSTSANNYFDGDLAEAAVWDEEFTTDYASLFANPISPMLVRPSTLVFYAPVIGNYSPEIEIIGGLSLTVTQAVKSVHPRILYPPQTQPVVFTPVSAPPATNTRRYSLPVMGVG